MKVLGINLGGHNHAAFIIDTDRKEIFAISLERVNRIKHDNNDLSLIVQEYAKEFEGIDYICLGGGGSGKSAYTINVGKYYIDTLKKRALVYKTLKPNYKKDQVELYAKKHHLDPSKMGLKNFLHYLYLTTKTNLVNHNDYSPIAFASHIANAFGKKHDDVTFYDHHLAHAASAYYFSGFNDEKVLSVTLDGYGDDFFSKVYLCSNNKMSFVGGSKVEIIKGATTQDIILSVGTLYGNFTEAMDLRRNSEEGKVEALAAYGDYNNETFGDLLASVSIEGESIVFNKGIEKYFSIEHLRQLRTSLGDENFCAIIQEFLNRLMSDYAEQLQEKYQATKICLSGGVAANVIMNLSIFETSNFDDIYVFPAMADDGVAAGAAVLKTIETGQDISFIKEITMPYWGPGINYRNDLLEVLEKNNHVITFTHDTNWPKVIAERLYNNEVGALVQGRMEYGPRALGNRSIIASPMNNDTRHKINKNIKKRPAYQPFCPSILESERERLFGKSLQNKHMTFAFRLKDEFKDSLPAASHVDLTARPQFVEVEDNKNYFNLLTEFKVLSGFGVLINTSFNLHGRTIVRTPQDAIDDFLDCHLDFLVIDDYIIVKQ